MNGTVVFYQIVAVVVGVVGVAAGNVPLAIFGITLALCAIAERGK